MRKTANKKRGAGVLLHISSLPSEYGIGSLGKKAYEFVDFLHSGGQRYWQILPLTPTGISNSPYQSHSAFAFNPLFIDLELLLLEGLLEEGELLTAQIPYSSRVNFSRVSQKKFRLLKKAFSRFDRSCPEFVSFCRCGEYFDYACYMTLKSMLGDSPWNTWPNSYKYRKRAALQALYKEKRSEIDFFLWIQYVFIGQWNALKSYANARGIRIIGDMPIYLDYDSVECWANPALLQLDDQLSPTGVAGVPPDYFSSTGQLWGNPLYDWEFHKKTGFSWWKKRIFHACKYFDFVRIDHFRGFYQYYAIPSTAASAKEGEWRNGSGVELFSSLPVRIQNQIIAEDLGLLDDGALGFFQRLGFPGMKVLQFAFDGNPHNPHLPVNYPKASVAYTGTHDNDTLRGWLSSLSNKPQIKKQIRLLASSFNLEKRPSSIMDYCELLIQIAQNSVADFCIIPIQDYLAEGSKFRINTPGTVSKNNWSYRLQSIPIHLAKTLYTYAQQSKR